MNTFVRDLAVGHVAEQEIRDELAYWGIATTPTEGKNRFDFFLPNGQSAEVKLDIFSLRTGNACIEYPSVKRGADWYFHILTYCKVYSGQQYEWLYRRGKGTNVGDQEYYARIIPKIEMKNQGIFLNQFIKNLKQ